MKWPKVTRSDRAPKLFKGSAKQNVVQAAAENGWEVFEQKTLDRWDKYKVRVVINEYQTIRKSSDHNFESAYDEIWSEVRTRGYIEDETLEEVKIV
jgi:hypothetical protein